MLLAYLMLTINAIMVFNVIRLLVYHLIIDCRSSSGKRYFYIEVVCYVGL